MVVGVTPGGKACINRAPAAGRVRSRKRAGPALGGDIKPRFAPKAKATKQMTTYLEQSCGSVVCAAAVVARSSAGETQGIFILGARDIYLFIAAVFVESWQASVRAGVLLYSGTPALTQQPADPALFQVETSRPALTAALDSSTHAALQATPRVLPVGPWTRVCDGRRLTNARWA